MENGRPPFRPLAPSTDPGQAFRENCTMNAMMSGAAGGAMGLVLGAVLMPFSASAQMDAEANKPLRQQIRTGVREMGVQSKSWGKSLMMIGAIFSCTECFVEKARGRHDRWNAVGGGCITGGILAANGARPASHASPPGRSVAADLLRCAARSRAAGDGDRLRGLRRLLLCDRRARLRSV